MTKDNGQMQFHEAIRAKVERFHEFKKLDYQPMSVVGDKLVYQRQLGFKEQMPGSAQWYEAGNRIVPRKTHYKNDCWICEKHVYSVIFWSRGRAY
jgi:hypothetical protein